MMMEPEGLDRGASRVVRSCRRHLGGLGAASIPPQACARRAGGMRLGAEPGGAACWRREGGEVLAAVAQLPGQRPPRRPFWALALARSGPILVQLQGALGHGALGKADGEQRVPSPYRSGGGRGRRLGRVSRQKEAEGSQPRG